MALAVSHTFADQETVTHTLLNAIETNIVNNANALISPLTAALNCNALTLDNMGPASNVDMGTGSGGATLVGVANSQTTTVGNIGAGTDDLMTYTLPANSLSSDGKAVRVTATGDFAANANTKTLAFVFGATTVTVNASTAAPNNRRWFVTAIIYRTGASAERLTGLASITTGIETVFDEAPVDATTGTIVIKFTGNSAASATDDVRQFSMLVEFLN